MSCEACCLVRVSVARGDGRHEADSPFHAITKIPRILDKEKCVNEAPRSHTGGFVRILGWSSHGVDDLSMEAP